jgi:hypothetical protein
MQKAKETWLNWEGMKERSHLCKRGMSNNNLTKEGNGMRIVNSKNIKNVTAPKVEPKAKAINPASAGQLGASTQFVKPPLVQGPGYNPKPMGSTGIANAQQGHSGVGPGGGGRTIYKSGSQSPTPEARDMPEGRNTLGEFGPGKRGG